MVEGSVKKAELSTLNFIGSRTNVNTYHRSCLDMDIKSEPARVIRMKELAHKISFQPSTIYGLIAKGKFPAPFKLVQGGRAAGWLEATIDDWIASRNDDSQHNNTK